MVDNVVIWRYIFIELCKKKWYNTYDFNSPIFKESFKYFPISKKIFRKDMEKRK